MHLIWISAFVPSLLFVIWAFPDARDPKIWRFLLLMGVVALAGIIAMDFLGFYPEASHEHSPITRSLLAIYTTTDIPAVALALGSFTNWMITGWMYRSRIKRSKLAAQAPN